MKKRSEKCAKKSRGLHKDRKGVVMEIEVQEEVKTTEAIEDSKAAKEGLLSTIIIVVKLISLQKRLSILVKNLRTKNSNSA